MCITHQFSQGINAIVEGCLCQPHLCAKEKASEPSEAPPFGSPGCNKGRTFRAEFRWYVTTVRPARVKAGKSYRNPVALALEWRMPLDTGRYSSPADLARKKAISRARVTQILNLLRLSPKVTGIIRGLGDPLSYPTVTERQLRGLINLPRRKQMKELTSILGSTQIR